MTRSIESNFVDTTEVMSERLEIDGLVSAMFFSIASILSSLTASQLPSVPAAHLPRNYFTIANKVDTQSKICKSIMKEEFNGAVALIIDYSNGVRKSFNSIPWRPEMAVYDVLQAAAATNPGLTFQFEKTFVDRGGRDVGMIVAIDDIAAEEESHKWLIWVNRSFIKTELRRVTPESVTQFGLPSVEPGDVIVFKFSEES